MRFGVGFGDITTVVLIFLLAGEKAVVQASTCFYLVLLVFEYTPTSHQFTSHQGDTSCI